MCDEARVETTRPTNAASMMKGGPDDRPPRRMRDPPAAVRSVGRVI